MTNKLYVKEGDLEVRIKKLIIPFQMYDEGPIRYEFHDTITIEVEENKADKKIIKHLRYRNFFLHADNDPDKIYRLNGDLRYLVGSLFNNLLHGGSSNKGEISKAIEEYLKGRPFPEYMRLERGSDWGNVLYVDLDGKTGE